jgi:hypothetical protein
LISDKLLTKVNYCNISASLECTLFDHKSISLSFCNKKKSLKHFIDPKIFSHPRFDAIVAVSACETYLQHADPGTVDIELGLAQVSNIISKLRKANDLEFDIVFEESTPLREATLLGLDNEIKMLVEDLPDPENLNELGLLCTNDIFLEVLMGNIRNSLVSFQTWLQKLENSKVSFLQRKINFLKGNYDFNQEEIANLESILAAHRDEALDLKIKNMKIFEHLHSERPSPLFLTLLKCRNTDSLSIVCDDNGSQFDTDELRDEHIVSYYEKVYNPDPKKKLLIMKTVLRIF